jgi:hypothetical protein
MTGARSSRWIGLAVAALPIALAGSPSPAAEIVNCALLDPNIADCTDYSGAGLLSMDLAFLETGSVSLTVEITASEATAGAIDLAGFVFNDTFADLARVTLALSGGATFASIGTVRDYDFAPVSVSGNATQATIEPIPVPPADATLEIGEVDSTTPGATNWILGVGDVGVARRFTLEIAVVPAPEPQIGASGSVAVASLLLAARTRWARSRAFGV